MKCETTTCQGFGGWRYTWPGRSEIRVCTRCAARAVGVAEAMGFDLEVKAIRLLMCAPHHLAHAEKLGQLMETSTPQAAMVAASELHELDREIMQCEACRRE